MNVVLALDKFSMTLVIVSGAVFFIILLVFFYFLFLRNRALAHQVKELSRRYDYLHSLLINENSKQLERIEEISQVNLLYQSIYDKQHARLLHLKDDKDVYVGQKISEFNEAINAKRYTPVRKQISEFKRFMTAFDEEVSKLNADLLDIIHPEDECNEMLEEANETFARIKQDYTFHLNDLILLKKSYTEVFKYVEKLFNEFAGYVEKANYEDANNLMPSIHKILGELETANRVMPSLCALASRTLPLRLADLESEYKRMDMESYPLYHIITPRQIANLREEVREFIKKLKSFNYKGQDEGLKAINTKIDNYLKAFEKEREDRATFEQEEAPTYQRVTKIEKDFIKLCNSIPKIQKVYAINDEKVSSRNKIQNHINRIGVSKRSLETFVHTVGKRQPYSALLARTLELKQEVDQVENEMLEFKNYLTSLKEDVEKAYESVSKYYYRVRRAEKILRDIAMPSVSEKYKAKIDQIYQYLEKINTTAMVLPIQVLEINNAVSFLNFEGESILNQIDQEETMLKLAESSLIYINKDRANFPELNNLVKQNEKAFFSGEFEKAYNETSKIIKRYAEMEE